MKKIKQQIEELKIKQELQYNYINGLLKTYRTFNKEVDETLLKEIHILLRLNDQICTLEEVI